MSKNLEDVSMPHQESNATPSGAPSKTPIAIQIHVHKEKAHRYTIDGPGMWAGVSPMFHQMCLYIPDGTYRLFGPLETVDPNLDAQIGQNQRRRTISHDYS